MLSTLHSLATSRGSGFSFAGTSRSRRSEFCRLNVPGRGNPGTTLWKSMLRKIGSAASKEAKEPSIESAGTEGSSQERCFFPHQRVICCLSVLGAEKSEASIASITLVLLFKRARSFLTYLPSISVHRIWHASWTRYRCSIDLRVGIRSLLCACELYLLRVC